MVKTRRSYALASSLFLIIFMLMGVSFADIELILETNVVDAELNSGSIMEMGAQVINQGECAVSCIYERTSFEGDDFSAKMGDGIQPGFILDFTINLMVPSCEDLNFCEVPIAVICKEQISESCAGNRFVKETVVSFTNVKGGSLDRTMNPLKNQTDRTANTRIDSMAGGDGKFEVTPQLTEMDSLEQGEKSSNTAVLANRDACPMRCIYKVQGSGYQEEVISERIAPGSKASFNIIFFVPDFCKDRCTITSHVTCFQLPDASGGAYCNSQNVYETDVSFELTNVMAPGDTTLGFVLLGIIVLAALALLYFGFRFVSQRFGKASRAKEDEEGRRKLSAIIFTDMKGYSKEVGRDEEATLKKMWRYEKVMKQIIKEHQGRVVKTIGDAIMGDFDSAVNAVKAAIAIQDLLKKEDIKIRVGIHLGDVIHKGGDIFGDGVNIASRLESICEPGEIYISEDVYNQVRGKIKVEFESLGRKPLKNIEVPPKVFRVKIGNPAKEKE